MKMIHTEKTKLLAKDVETALAVPPKKAHPLLQTTAFGINSLAVASYIVMNGKFIALLNPSASGIVGPYQSVILAAGLGSTLSTGLELAKPIANKQYLVAGDVEKAGIVTDLIIGSLTTSTMLVMRRILPLIFESEAAGIAGAFFTGAAIGNIPLMMVITDAQLAFQEGHWFIPPLAGIFLLTLSVPSSYLLGFLAKQGAIGIGLGSSLAPVVVCLAMRVWLLTNPYKKYELHKFPDLGIRYDLCLMPPEVENDLQKAEKNKLYIKLSSDPTADSFSYLIPGKKEYAEIKFEDLGIEPAIALEELKKMKNDILEITLKRGHTQSTFAEKIKKSFIQGAELSVQRLTEWANLSLIADVIGIHGNTALKAINPLFEYFRLFGAIYQGIGQGTGMLVSKSRELMENAIKKKNKFEAQLHYRNSVRTMLYSGGLGLLTAGIFNASFYFLRRPLTTFFTGNESSDVQELSETLLWIGMLGLIPDSLRLVTIGALRGWKDLFYPMLMSLVTMIAIGIPAGWGISEIYKDDDTKEKSESAFMLYARNAMVLTAAIILMGRCVKLLLTDVLDINAITQSEEQSQEQASVIVIDDKGEEKANRYLFNDERRRSQEPKEDQVDDDTQIDKLGLPQLTINNGNDQ